MNTPSFPNMKVSMKIMVCSGWRPQTRFVKRIKTWNAGFEFSEEKKKKKKRRKKEGWPKIANDWCLSIETLIQVLVHFSNPGFAAFSAWRWNFPEEFTLPRHSLEPSLLSFFMFSKRQALACVSEPERQALVYRCYYYCKHLAPKRHKKHYSIFP